MCAFPGRDLGDVTRFTKGLKGWGLLDKTILCWFHVRDNLCGGIFKRIIFMHYAKAINVIGGSYKRSYATDKIEDSSGMESCAYIPNTVQFPFPKESACNLNTMASHNWLEETLTREVFFVFFFNSLSNKSQRGNRMSSMLAMSS